ncbi:MAG: hypothetical protein NVSMB3_00160 [Acidobacteriaceae bacterium]
MKRIAALLFLLPLVPVAAHADEASKRAKVQELFTLLHVDQISTQIMGNLNRQLQGLSAHQFGATPTAEQQKQFGDFQNRISGLVQQTVGWKTVEPDFVKLYSDTYTEPEVDSFLTFYKSPAGQTMLSKSPEVASKSLALTQQRMATIEPQLRQMVAEFVKQTTPASTAPPTLNSLPPSTSTPPKK